MKDGLVKDILIIDSNEKNCREYTVFLESEGYTVTVANNVEEGFRYIAHAEPAVVLLEATLPEMSVSAALERIQRNHQDVIVIVIGVDAVTTIEAMRLGAFDVVPKPVDLEVVKCLVAHAFRMRTTRSTLPVELVDASAIVKDGPLLVGRSRQMHEIYKLIGIMASNTMTVLIEGETGTGKDLVARAIHAGSEHESEPERTRAARTVPRRSLLPLQAYHDPTAAPA